MACMRLLWLMLLLLPARSYGWWLFSSTKVDSDEAGAPSETRRPVQFEMNTAEDKFLAEAQQFLDLPQLDQCQHSVISRLRSSCGQMHEEALGKLAVDLLNCQSLTEGRPTYSCSRSMSLAECTGPMDASTWNAYHIISNRARSVCYATRQEHFKRQTEVAVNQLSKSTLQQLSAMHELTSSHQQIRDFTRESLETMQSQQSDLVDRQEELAARQDTVKEKVTFNLEQLSKEKNLIRSGQKILVNMTDSIKQQLEEASSLLSIQEKNRRQGQSEIIEDLSRVRENIQEVWNRIDTSTSQLLRVMTDISDKYESTLTNLDRINSSVSSMMSIVVRMDRGIRGQLEWLIGQLGGAQDGLRVLTLLITHTVFLLLATLCVLFVRAPAFARVTLLSLVCLNVFLEIYYHVSLTFAALAVLEALFIACNWLYLWIRSRKFSVPPALSRMEPCPQPLPLPDESWDAEFSMDFRHSSTPIPNDIETITPTCTPTKPVAQATSKPPGLKCTARTRAGSKCRLPATPGEIKCRRHL